MKLNFQKREEKKREKTYRIKTNNQELLIRKENESDATSRWIITGNEKEKSKEKKDEVKEGFVEEKKDIKP